MDKEVTEVRIRHWIRVFELQAKSGKNKTLWCAENGINRSAFYYWQRVIRKYALNRPDISNAPCVVPQEDNGPVFVELNDNDQNSLPICGHVQTEEPPVKQQMLPIPDVNSSRITINYRGFSIDVSNGVDEASLKKALKVVKDIG